MEKKGWREKGKPSLIFGIEDIVDDGEKQERELGEEMDMSMFFFFFWQEL